MAKIDLAKLSDEELHAENQRLMGERAEADQLYKAQQKAIAVELDNRAGRAKVASVVADLSPTVKAELLELLRAEGDENRG